MQALDLSPEEAATVAVLLRRLRYAVEAQGRRDADTIASLARVLRNPSLSAAGDVEHVAGWVRNITKQGRA
jgi:hypothetical protein